MAERLRSADVGCWVIKSRTPAAELDAAWDVGTSKGFARCLRRSYRVELMQPGDRCLLWVSGRSQPGVQAIGTLTSRARTAPESGASPAEVQVSVRLRRLGGPVPRAWLLADQVLARAEVLRMPAGSNPSYLSPELLAALRDFLSPTDVTGAGW